MFTPAGDGVMPKGLARQNTHGVPANAMWLTSIMVQLFLLVTLLSKASYLAVISLSTAMILLPYLFSAIYGLVIAVRREGAPEAIKPIDLPITAFATVYCAWLLYAAGPKYVMLSALLYAPGALVYVLAKREQKLRVFATFEWVICAALCVLAVVGGYLLATGNLTL